MNIGEIAGVIGSLALLTPMARVIKDWHLAVRKTPRTPKPNQLAAATAQSAASQVQPAAQSRRGFWFWFRVFMLVLRCVGLIYAYWILVWYFLAGVTVYSTRDVALMILAGCLFVVCSRTDDPSP